MSASPGPPARRAAVYNRFWHTQGGGERHSGMIAQCLSRRGVQVDLLAHTPVDPASLGAHLGLDLSGCAVRILPEWDEDALAEHTADYDLLVNGSYMSRLRPKSRRAAYLCYFPTPPDHDLPGWRKLAARVLQPVVGRPAAAGLSFGEGWYGPESARLRTWRWTSGEGHLTVAPGPERDLHFEVGRPALAGTDLRVATAAGDLLLQTTISARFSPHSVTVPASDDPLTVVFSSGSDPAPGADPRTLGVNASRFYVGRRPTPRQRLAGRLGWVHLVGSDHSYLDGYDVIFANSLYTMGWIARLWRRESEVLYPPIQVDGFVPSPERDRSIVTVGRFFDPLHGHSKRQLEQVRLFAKMVGEGRLAGWTFHLIGGCEPAHQPYLDAVRAAAAGFPVELHVNAPRDELVAILSRASIQWSATGYGADEDDEPWASEHFGMTTVEAMAAGCVPVVIDRAGQREIVEPGVNGFRWSTLDELAEHTVQLAEDDALRSALAKAAVESARTYSDAAFAARLDGLIDRYDLLG